MKSRLALVFHGAPSIIALYSGLGVFIPRQDVVCKASRYLADETNVMVKSGRCHGVFGGPNARAHGLLKTRLFRRACREFSANFDQGEPVHPPLHAKAPHCESSSLRNDSICTSKINPMPTGAIGSSTLLECCS
jgi:hypothetical protein